VRAARRQRQQQPAPSRWKSASGRCSSSASIAQNISYFNRDQSKLSSSYGSSASNVGGAVVASSAAATATATIRLTSHSQQNGISSLNSSFRAFDLSSSAEHTHGGSSSLALLNAVSSALTEENFRNRYEEEEGTISDALLCQRFPRSMPW
jgi:hypothetical protein